VLDSLPKQTLYDVTWQSRVGALWTPQVTIVGGSAVPS
jgi:hypothetical protein